MHAREIRSGIEVIASVHWERRLFDALIPLPDGTSYNAYLVTGSEGVALIDSSDPEFQEELLTRLEGISRIDFVVSNHAEQDHSGAIPAVLERFPEAQAVCSSKGKELLENLLLIPSDRIRVVDDGESISLGDKTMTFVYTPWVHWPETMVTHIPEAKVLFSCDFFGSHIATTDVYVTDRSQVYEAAKRYFAEIMMPYRAAIRGNLAKIDALDYDLIAPSHGPVYDDPQFIVEAYHQWVGTEVRNEVVLPYVSMHGSTGRMVTYLIDALSKRGVTVHAFDLAVTDIGKLAIALVDAATLIVGTPTVQLGPHPAVVYAAYLANLLRPKLKYAAIIGSYGWNSKAVEQIADMIPNLKVEVLATIMKKGLPDADTYRELDALADDVAEAHRSDEAVVVA